MSTPTPAEVENAKALLAAAAAANGNQQTQIPWNGAPAPVSSWAAPAPAMGAVPTPEKVLVPIKLQCPDGSTLRIYMQFPGDLAANPQAMMAAIGALKAAGIPLDTWQPQNRGWGGGGGYGNRGGNGGSGGGGGWGNRSSW